MSVRDAVVVGGGPAGSYLATRLAQAGRDVLVLERERAAHDKVCGEFLSDTTVESLRRIGLSLTDLGGLRVETVALHRDRTVAESAIPFRAFSLTRRALDEAMLRHAEAVGAELRRGSRVVAVERTGELWSVHPASGPDVRAREVFLATGKHDLRKLKRPPGRQDDLLGFKQHWRLSQTMAVSLAGRVELHLFPGGYAGLQLTERGDANLCLVVSRHGFAKAGGSWPGLVEHLTKTCPSLTERLQGGIPRHERPSAVGHIPYGFVQRDPEGLWRLGDQAAVVPSFTGEGVSMALKSAQMAADHVLSGASAAQFQRAFARLVGTRVAFATTISQALVAGWAQPAASAAMRIAPQLLGVIAAKTRMR